MNVLIIARGYPTNKYKMNGIFEFDQAKALVEAGHNVFYAAIDLRSLRRWRKWGIERKSIDGVNIYAINIPCGRIPKIVLRKIAFFGLRIIYNKIIKDYRKPDIMHAHFTFFSYIATKLKEETNIPLVITEHSSQINKENINNDLYSIAKIAYSKANALIAVSPYLAMMIFKNFNKESICIPNIVDLDMFEYKEKIERQIFNFVSVGNLIENKRMDLLIEAYYRVFGNNPRVTLSIFGQGPERKMLESLINKYGLNSQIKLMGLCTRERIAEQFKKSDCFVLVSKSETFGVAYVEALACGIPVIATRCGGPEMFVNANNGLMIDINDIEQLTEAMDYMYNHIDNYNRKDISMEIRKKFSAKVVATELTNLYRKILITQ